MMIVRSNPLVVSFYKTENGNEPAREWLSSLSREQKKAIGEDVKTVQFGWPLGMPLVEKLEANLWEVRTKLKDGIARVLFTMIDENIIIVHGFIKKSKRIPKSDLELAKKRVKMLRGQIK